jgi:hypothetical protein
MLAIKVLGTVVSAMEQTAVAVTDAIKEQEWTLMSGLN